MAERIRINTKTLQSDTSVIDKRLKNVVKKIESMQADVTEMNRMWEGEANKAFQKAFQDDIQVMGELCKSIQEIIRYEVNAKAEYDSCENKVASMISSINI